MRWVLLSCLIACGFQSTATPLLQIDAAVPDAAVPDAAVPDATPCQVGASSTSIDRGQVGLSTGGGTFQTLACDGDARIIGLALDMSDQPANGEDDDSARGIRIGCATVTIGAAQGSAGPIATKDSEGHGGSGWTPSTLTALALCPPGAVLSGLLVHGGGKGGGNLFLDATMTCTTFDVTAKLITTTAVPIAGSQTEPLQPSQVQCEAGEQVVSMMTDTGAGLDSLRLSCAPTICK
ncbi:MAG TPA: hypothetical protein VH165_04775 [Kofleriaceae bacterium]|nr:hypothetical protein [Kofleriaceae bacterium]